MIVKSPSLKVLPVHPNVNQDNPFFIDLIKLEFYCVYSYEDFKDLEKYSEM